VRAATAVLVVLAGSAVGCTDADDTTADDAATDGSPPPAATSSIVSGPLCEFLPGEGDPGGPDALENEAADVALTWMPVLTVFEAGVRATGLDEDLNAADGITILAPTDDAFDAVLSEQTLDDLILFRQDELRALLERHVIDEPLGLAELVAAGTVTTRAGEAVTVTAEGDMARLDQDVVTVCADYRVGNGRIHIIDGVLGELPEPAPEDEDIGN